MGKKRAFILARIDNLARGAKAVIERLSPRKKRRIGQQENEHPAGPSRSSSISEDAVQRSNYTDVFLEAPTTPLGPRRRATVESVLDEDDVSYLAGLSGAQSGEQSGDESGDNSGLDSDDPETDLDEEMTRAAHAQDRPPPAPSTHIPDGKLREAPTVSDALAALLDLRELLRPHRQTGRGYLDPGIDPFVRIRMESMQIMLNFYTQDLSKTKGFWAASSLQAAVSQGKGRYCARQLRTMLLQCPNFKCAPPALDCCCRRILYNQPDFEAVCSLLEEDIRDAGFGLIFIPKFHCELNFIEQCWGYAKRLYCLNPESSREDALVRNTLEALDAVLIVSMRRFANRSQRFIDAYDQGATGTLAAWAVRKFPGHRMIPIRLMNDMEREAQS
ncbi:hypothetical protein C8J57DRAFT_1586298 [Mycena rebaudengoi]|nr:hypothetical protein C8J57DRAFT_1586298 [Mycena rebaudengoi]